MKLLVTGGAGFIGSNFIRYIIKTHPDYKLICVDALTYAGNIDNLSNIIDGEKVKFIKENICNRPEMEKICIDEKPDIIINFAAQTHVDRSINNPQEFIQTNINGVYILLECCRKIGIKRFHQISTDEVYGDQLKNNQTSCDENCSVIGTNPYAATKGAADLLVQAYHHTYGLDTSITRCANNLGPYQNKEKLVPKVILNAINNIPIPVYGNGQNIRDWIYVEDHCSAIDAVILKGKPGEIYNISSHNEIANIDLVKMILHEMDKDEKLITYVDDRPGHTLRHSIKTDKIERDLGWHPKWDLLSSVRQTIDWYKNNRSCCNDKKESFI